MYIICKFLLRQLIAARVNYSTHHNELCMIIKIVLFGEMRCGRMRIIYTKQQCLVMPTWFSNLYDILYTYSTRTALEVSIQNKRDKRDPQRGQMGQLS